MKNKSWMCWLSILSFSLLLTACGEDEPPAPEPTKETVEKPAPKKIDLNTKDLAQMKINAESGNAEAQLKLAAYYDIRGQYKEAFQWYQKSAKQNNAAAQRSLGYLYNEGNGVEVDPVLAYSWYRKAALQNDAEAMLGLVNFFSEGILVEADEFKADELLQKAKHLFEQQAAKNDVNAQRNLGVLLVEEGTDQEVKEGLEWLTKAAETGDAKAQLSLGWAYLQENSASNLPDLNLAVSWYEKAATQESIEAFLELGNLYPRLGLTQENMNKTIDVYSRAAQTGSSVAQVELASLYLNGGRFVGNDFVKPDPKKAVELLTKAAEANNNEAIEKLIDLYENGESGVEKNTEEALKWSKRQVQNVEAKIAKTVNEAKPAETTATKEDAKDKKSQK